MRVGGLDEGVDLLDSGVEEDFRAGLFEDLADGFQVKACAGDFWSFEVFVELGFEGGDIALGFVDAFGFVTFGSLDLLVGEAAGAWDDFVVFAVGDVDEVFAILLGFVDFVEGVLDRDWWVDVFELDLVDEYAEFVGIDEFDEFFFGGGFDVLAADGDDFIDGAVADDFAHDGFAEVAQGFDGFVDVEEVEVWILNAVLNDPIHQDGVEVASDHGALQVGIGSVAGFERR